MRLDSRDRLLKGGEEGPSIVPGKPAESVMIEALRYESLEMPPDDPLPAKEIAAIEEWIKRGAPWPKQGGKFAVLRPRAAEFTEEDRAFWSFQPIAHVPPPKVEDQGWSKTPIDAFIFRRLQQDGLKPAPAAARVQLVRRLCFDLLGLPPTPKQIDKFLADKSPDAYEQLVDRLLESDHYGEQWARHWLDVVRFAESDGYREDAFRPTAWRYRDYVVQSFNSDKPYPQFVQEQLAGDEMAPDDPAARIATGFLRQGVYEWNQRDAETQRSDMHNEITDVTSDVFLGLGLSCARCHDHKFDPILQKDYFRLQAFFAPLQFQDNLPVATRGQLQIHHQQLAAWEQKTAAIRAEISELESPGLKNAENNAVKIFPDNVQEMYWKPREQRTSYEDQIADLVFRQVLVAKRKAVEKMKDKEKKRWDELKQQLAKFDQEKPKPFPTMLSVTDSGLKVAPTHIPDLDDKNPIAPGFVSLLDEKPATIHALPEVPTSTGRRTALAKWLTQPEHPLTARVIVNRIWQKHFGRGLVATASDLGHLGERPSHPELLDWLARQFVKDGSSFKSLDRLIVLSSVYRQSALSDPPAQAIKVDPSNLLLWQMKMRRLQAEQIRDAVLSSTGELDRTLGGASVKGSSSRRSLYVKVIRNTPDPLLSAFDSPPGFSSTPTRNVTTTAPQALLMLNGSWALTRASVLAKRLSKECGDDLPAQVSLAYQLAYGRTPTDDESSVAVRFLQQRSPVASPEQMKKESIVKTFPGRDSHAIDFSGVGSTKTLRVPHSSQLPVSDFTVEAYVMLRSLFEDAAVRTIVSHWDSNTSHPGWALGVTSKKSRYTPQNLILQMVGDPAKKGGGYEVIASGIHLELNRPYYVAATVKLSGRKKGQVVFHVKDLAKDSKLQEATVLHGITGHFHTKLSIVLGGRDHGGQNHVWDGLIDDVRISRGALSKDQLIVQGGKLVTDETIGFWKFEAEPGIYHDSATRAGDIQLQQIGTKPVNASQRKLTDLCHALLNSNEFLYVD